MRKLAGKKVLVTGGAGFIGSHLVEDIVAEGAASVVVLDNFFIGTELNLASVMKDNPQVSIYRDDARHYGVLNYIIEKEQIDVVFNMATIALNYSFVNPSDAYMVNVQIMEGLLNLLKDGKYQTLVHASSSEAYGTAIHVPMNENHPLNPTTSYAAGKAASDIMAQSYYNMFGLDITTVRPFNNYGPRQNDGFLAAIVPLTAKRILNGEQPIIEGTGEQTRDFIYVTDTSRAFIQAYNQDEKMRGRLVNVASGTEVTMNKLVQLISDYLDYKGDVIYTAERPADVKRLYADVTLAKELIGFSPTISIEQGIGMTLDYYLAKWK